MSLSTCSSRIAPAGRRHSRRAACSGGEAVSVHARRRRRPRRRRRTPGRAGDRPRRSSQKAMPLDVDGDRHGDRRVDRRRPRADHRRADVGATSRKATTSSRARSSSRSTGGRSRRRCSRREATLQRDTAQAANAKAQAARYQDLRAARHRDARSRSIRSTTQRRGARRDGRRRPRGVENAKVQLQYATIAAPISGPHRRADGARGQSRARQRHDAARRHQPDHADLRLVRHPRGACCPSCKRYMAQGTLARRGARRPNDTGAPSTGRITFVDNAVDPTTGTIKVKGTFPNDRPPALAGPVRQRDRHADDRRRTRSSCRRRRCRPASRARTSSSSSRTRPWSCGR